MSPRIKAIYRRVPLIILLAVLLVSTIVLVQLVVFHSKINLGFFTYNEGKKFAECKLENRFFFENGDPENGGFKGYGLNSEDLLESYCRNHSKRLPLFIKSQ